jgi:hypothetical protein
MGQLFAALLTLIIVLMGLALILQVPPRTVLRVGGKWGGIVLLTTFLMVQAPALLEHLQTNPPRSLRELAVWLGIAFALFLVCLRLVFGRGAVSRFFERIITSAVYDTLKGVAKFFLGRH